MPITTVTSHSNFTATAFTSEAIKQTGREPVRLGSSSSIQTGMFGKDGFSFGDLLDVVNPLQQLPVVGSVYRAATGASISPFARMAGGALLGGPVGFAIAAINSAFEAATGSDVTETAMKAVTGTDSTSPYGHLTELRGSKNTVVDKPESYNATPVLSANEAIVQRTQQSALLDILAQEMREVNYQRKRSDRGKHDAYDKSQQLASTLYDLAVVK